LQAVGPRSDSLIGEANINRDYYAIANAFLMPHMAAGAAEDGVLGRYLRSGREIPVHWLDRTFGPCRIDWPHD
jgi:hypothetical protein